MYHKYLYFYISIWATYIYQIIIIIKDLFFIHLFFRLHLARWSGEERGGGRDNQTGPGKTHQESGEPTASLHPVRTHLTCHKAYSREGNGYHSLSLFLKDESGQDFKEI